MRRSLIHLAASLAALLVGALVWNGTVDYTDSDSFGTLIVAESILDHATIDLSRDRERIERSPWRHRFVTIRGGLYYSFPIGTSLFAVPWVAVEHAFGHRMWDEERAAQIRLSAVVAAGIFLLGWQIARLYVGDAAGLVLALLFSLGTPLASTLGSALWSHDFTVLFTLAALLHLVRYDVGKTAALRPAWLSLVLFAAYLCRPTAAVLVVCVLAYLSAVERRAAWTTAAAIVGVFAAFVAFSRAEFDSWLPPYYRPQRLSAHSMLGVAIEQNLFGPNRGLFVYSPFLLVAALVLAWRGRALLRDPLMALALAFPALHLLVVSSLPKWWAGGCFGPRYMVDALPGLLVASALVWRETSRATIARFSRIALASALAVLGAFSIWVNTYQALYNRYTRWWNRFPGATPNAVRDWRYPQLLFNEQRFRAAEREVKRGRELAMLGAVAVGEEVSFGDARLGLLDGWSNAEADRRWSDGHTATIFVRPAPGAAASGYRLRLRLATLGAQRVEAWWNGRALGAQTLDSRDAVLVEWPLPAEAVDLGGVNEIRLALPDAARAPGGDPRTLAIALVSFALVPAP